MALAGESPVPPRLHEDKRRESFLALDYDVRENFDLTAQMVVRCIAKVADGYKVSTKKQRGFKQYGAIAYDNLQAYQLNWSTLPTRPERVLSVVTRHYVK